jgi:ribose 5-phosphate isomerase A
MARMRELDGQPVLREGQGKVGPLVTDNCNFVVDVDFGPLDDAKELNVKLKLISGVIETGLFVGMADIVYLGKPDGVEKLVKD